MRRHHSPRPVGPPAPQRAAEPRGRGGVGRGLARQPLGVAPCALDLGADALGLLVVQQGRRELLHDVEEPAHPSVLRLLLGPRRGVCARGPGEDRPQGSGRRHQPLCAALAELRGCRQLPRWHGRRPLPVASRDLEAGPRHQLRDQSALPGLLPRVQGGLLPVCGHHLQGHECGSHLRQFLPGGRSLLGLGLVPERVHLRLRLHQRRRRHDEGDLPPRPHLLWYRRDAAAQLRERDHQDGGRRH
mmetsp:Transcript_111814/g.281385  ORF Transcript_111814/g.281385 Transcript_111814/m.281385 type:complete len:244 (-) Transcript_111814:621-1352(-)